MYEMGLTRLSDLSLHFYIREGMSKTVHSADSTTDDNLSYKFPHTKLVSTMPIFIYIDGVLADPSTYELYPESGSVVFNSQVSGHVTADYNYSIMSVIDSYTGDLVYPPLVAIENQSDSSKPVEIGSMSSFVSYKYIFHLYGEHEGERDDYVDMLRDVLRGGCPVLNFNNGFPIDGEGRLTDVAYLNPDDPVNEGRVLEDGYVFNEDKEFYEFFKYLFDIGVYRRDEVLGHLYFGEPRVVRNPLNSSDVIERGRANIYINCEIYKP